MRLPLRARRVLQRVFCDLTEPLAPFLFSRVYFFPFSGGVLPLSALTGRRLYFIPFSRRSFSVLYLRRSLMQKNRKTAHIISAAAPATANTGLNRDGTGKAAHTLQESAKGLQLRFIARADSLTALYICFFILFFLYVFMAVNSGKAK